MVKIGQKLVKNWSKIDQKLVISWSKIGPKLVENWAKIGQKSVLSYCQNYLGKGFTMGYAMLGIPMAMIMFQSMGERMNKVFSIVISKWRKFRGHRRPQEVTEFDLIVASGLTSTLVVTLGAVLYHSQEGWSFFDAYYYCFITLSTIGFGDYVALQSGGALEVRKTRLKSLQGTQGSTSCVPNASPIHSQ